MDHILHTNTYTIRYYQLLSHATRSLRASPEPEFYKKYPCQKLRRNPADHIAGEIQKQEELRILVVGLSTIICYQILLYTIKHC